MTTSTSPAASSPADPRRWAILIVIGFCQLMLVLDSSIVTIALPQAQQELGISNANRQWIVTAYALAFGGLLLLGGRIADSAGRRRVFVIGLVGFALVSALGGLAPNEAVLFGARGLQGAFAAIMAPAALSLLAVTFTNGKERATAFSVYGGISGGGAALGITHDYIEEVYILDGELEDLGLGEVFTAGTYTSRQPGMCHGPYRTSSGCLMFEIRYRPYAGSGQDSIRPTTVEREA